MTAAARGRWLALLGALGGLLAANLVRDALSFGLVVVSIPFVVTGAIVGAAGGGIGVLVARRGWAGGLALLVLAIASALFWGLAGRMHTNEAVGGALAAALAMRLWPDQPLRGWVAGGLAGALGAAVLVSLGGWTIMLLYPAGVAVGAMVGLVPAGVGRDPVAGIAGFGLAGGVVASAAFAGMVAPWIWLGAVVGWLIARRMLARQPATCGAPVPE